MLQRCCITSLQTWDYPRLSWIVLDSMLVLHLETYSSSGRWQLTILKVLHASARSVWAQAMTNTSKMPLLRFALVTLACFGRIYLLLSVSKPHTSILFNIHRFHSCLGVPHFTVESWAGGISGTLERLDLWVQRLGELVSEKMLPGRPLAAITHHEHEHPETPEIQWITVPYSNYSYDIIFTSIHMYMYAHLYVCMYVQYM